MTNGVVVTRPLGLNEQFFRARTESGVYKSFHATATYSRPLTNLPLFYRALRKTLLDYHILTCNVHDTKEPSTSRYVYRPVLDFSLGDVLIPLAMCPEDYAHGNVTEAYLKKINVTKFTLYNGSPLFRIWLLGDTVMTVAFEHTIADGMVGVYFHQEFVANLAYVTQYPEKYELHYGTLDGTVTLESKIFDFAQDRSRLTTSLPPVIEHFMDDVNVSYKKNPSYFPFPVPEGYSKWPGRFDMKLGLDFTFKFINFSPDQVDKILLKCRAEKVSLTAIFDVCFAFVLKELVGDHYSVGKVAVSLRRHMSREKAPPEFKDTFDRFLIGTYACLGLDVNFPPLESISWDFVRQVAAFIKLTYENNSMLNLVKPFTDGEPYSGASYNFFTSGLGKRRPETFKLSNLGFVPTPEHYDGWYNCNFVFSQDVSPFSADFMLNCVSDKRSGLNLVLSYIDDYLDIPGNELETILLRFKQVLIDVIG